MKNIRRVAILGAGTMGSRIAAQFANGGTPVLLLDMVAPGEPERNTTALHGIEGARRSGAFYTEGARTLVEAGNFEDHLGGIGDCDWVIEAVIEHPEVKRELLEHAAQWRRTGAIVSTTTSGLPMTLLCDGLAPEFRRNFLGTQFFHPPRERHLVELIPSPDTDPHVVEFVARFCELRLGRGVILAKDTPNFIANRVASFLAAAAMRRMAEGAYSIEEIDLLTGPLIGFPQTATFGMIDAAGLDVWASIGNNLYELAPDDPWRDRLLPPEFLQEMIERGWLGEKAGQGFYRGGDAIEWRTLEYRPRQAASFGSVDSALRLPKLAERLRFLIHSSDRAGTLLWRLLSDLFVYAAGRVPEIADRVVEIDRAMRWGYGWALGPFELWDAVGVEDACERMRGEGRTIPANVEIMLASGAQSFYQGADSGREPQVEYFDLGRATYELIEERDGVLALGEIKRARGVVRKNAGASLIDIGDGVLCLELHGEGSLLGDDQLEMASAALEELEREYEALVVTGDGGGFSAGIHLAPVLAAVESGAWETLEAAVSRFQQVNLALKYAACPVVMAPAGRAIGAGCQVLLHASRVQAEAGLAMGFDEIAAGLIPAGGGTKEMLLRVGDAAAMAVISGGNMSASAFAAREMGLLRADDGISMNPERLLAEAKEAALAMAPAWTPRVPPTEFEVSGDAGYARLRIGAWTARQAHRMSACELDVADRLAFVLSGGGLTGRQKVTEAYLLDLEREAFLSLCGREKTRARMEHLVRTGRPLEN